MREHKRFLDTEAWKWIKLILEIALIAALIWGAIYVYTSMGFAAAEPMYEIGYVLCADYVNVRPYPNKKGEILGRLETGDIVYLDGTKKNGYLHVSCTGLEDDGWIYKGYIVYDMPEKVGQYATIVSKGRLAARKNVGGRRTRWLKPLASVFVYYWSDEWAVTNCGYVQSKYLELDGELYGM